MAIRIAISLPDDLVAALDRLIEDGTFPSRSAAVSRAVRELLAKRAATDQAFARGFRADPETADERSDAMQLAVETINDEPWEKWW